MSEKKQRKSFKELLHIFEFALEYKGTFAIGLVFLFLSSATVLVFPFVTGKMVDAATGESDWWLKDINIIALGLIGILLLQSIFSYLRVYLFSLVSEKTMAKIRTTLYNKLITLHIPFFEERRTGELISRITSDTSQLQDVLSTGLAEFFRQITTMIIGITIILVTSPKLTLVMLSTFPALIIVAYFFGKFIKKLSKETQDNLANSNVIVEETLHAIQIVKAYTNEWFESKRYAKSQEDVVDIAMKTAKYRGAFISFIIFGLFGAIVLVLWYGAQLITEGEITIGDLTSFLIYTTFIGGSIGGFGEIYSRIQKALGASERIREIIGEDHEVDLATIRSSFKPKGKIQFDQVAFSYPSRKETEVLKSISLQIAPGQQVAFVGPSGSGKSTIARLLLRFYHLASGKILIDDQNIEDINISDLRSAISIVPQEVILFGGTIKENIAYGKPDAKNEEIRAAAEKANALEFIDQLSEGMKTIIGEKGIKLSGGQRQRISIARAILKDPAILVLDEATSSLDASSEKLVQEALDNLMKGRTSIVIAHRLATIKNADKIFVIQDGTIVEQGLHSELINTNDGLYQRLSKLQFELN